MDDLNAALRDDLGRRESGPEYLTSAALAPLFWPAERLDAASAWWLHVPFGHWVVAATAPRALVELGTHAGVSYAAFCGAVARGGLGTRCHAVDTWRGDPHAGEYGEEVFEEFRRFHDEHYGCFSTLLRCTFDEALDKFPDRSIDLLHIDGLHTYEAVRHDFEAWEPKVSDQGVVLFHDTNERRDDFGVWRLWAELRERYAGFEFLHGHGLGVLAVGARPPSAIAWLAALDDQAAAALRTRFHRLGERWLAGHSERALRRKLGASAAASAAQAARADTAEGSVAEAMARAGRAETAAAEAAARAEEAAASLAEAMARTERAETTAAEATARADAAEATLAEAEQAREQARATSAEACKAVEAIAAEAERVRQRAAAASAAAVAERARLKALAVETEARRGDDAAVMAAKLTEAQVGRAVAAAQRDALLYSTTWLATRPLRLIGGAVPVPARRAVRWLVLAGYWLTTLQRPTPPAEFDSPEIAAPSEIPQLCREEFAPPQPVATPAPQERIGPRDEPVDIVICVHNALADVRACIESVLRCTMPPYRIIVVDDGSGPETASYLDDQAREQRAVLLRNAKAQGYTRAANAGLRAVTAPWVVLLNSDTVVSPGWLDRMWAHGAADPSIGVIGPLSNTASWQSVPRIFEGKDWARNPLPPGLGVDEMASLVARGAVGAIPMPFINGFCYMIRSTLLKSIGLFDEATFAAGYGEENDFSVRVRNAGWSLAVATDAYVYHAQSMSYSQDRRLALAKRSDQLLLEKHDPRLHIWPQVSECRDSLAMASVRARLDGALLSRELIREGRERFEGKRIAFLFPVAERGGGAGVIVQEGKALERMGVDVTLINLEHFQQALGPAPELASFDLRIFANPGAITAHLLREQDRYDAVIATLYTTVSWLPVHASFRLGYYVQDFEPYFFPEGSPEYATALLSYTFSDRIRLVTKTLWNQKEIAQRTGRHAFVLGPSVDTAAFAPGPNRKPGDPVRIAAMVRPSTPRRAPGRTVSVLERVVGALGDSVLVTFFGSTDDELDAVGLRRPWAANAGPQNRCGMAALLAGTDVFLDCSSHQAMGLTALEAMLSGCAVVAPQRGGCNDFIRAGVNGVLVDSTDERACADAVLRLASDEANLHVIRAGAVRDAGSYVPERAALSLLKAMLND